MTTLLKKFKRYRSKDIRFVIFRCKITHHILPTNATSFRDKIKDKDQCHLCEQNTNTNSLICILLTRYKGSGLNSHIGGIPNDDSIVLNEKNINYGLTNNFALKLGLNQ